jgi:protein phosphatase
LLAVAKSDIGLIRQTNEDSYECINPNLYIVADGMGGHLAGEVASKMAVDVIKNYICIHIDSELNLESLLKNAILEANKMIFEKAHQDKDYLGMGTTVSIAYCKDTQMFWGHVGDSRIYLLRNNELIQITKDHSLVWDLLENGSITKAEAKVHPQRNVLTRAVGVDENLLVDTGVCNLFRNDRLLLCTDGLTNMLNEDIIKEAISSETIDLKESIDFLVDAAIAAGGSDNITVILSEI